MKKLILIAFMVGLSACAKKDPVTTCNMQYSCYSSNIGGYNSACASQYGTSTHSGSFSNGDEGTAEAECVAWEYAFINGYGSTYSPYAHPSVTQCSCSTN
jgi:hypothetical protein